MHNSDCHLSLYLVFILSVTNLCTKMLGSQLHQGQLTQSYKSISTKQIAYIKAKIRRLCELKAYVSEETVWQLSFYYFYVCQLEDVPLDIYMMFITSGAVFSFRYCYYNSVAYSSNNIFQIVLWHTSIIHSTIMNGNYGTVHHLNAAW